MARRALGELLGEYVDVVNKHGLGSDHVKKFRSLHADDSVFVRYADALDCIKRRLQEGKRAHGK